MRKGGKSKGGSWTPAQREAWERRKAQSKETSVEQTTPAVTPEVDADEALRRQVMQQVQAAMSTYESESKPNPEPVAPPEPEWEMTPPLRATGEDDEIRAGIPKLQERPVAPPARDEQQRTLAALVEEQRTENVPDSGHLKLPKRRPGEPTEQYTERLVDVMMVAMAKRRQMVLERRRLRKPINDIPPVEIFMPTRRDNAAPPPGARCTDGWWKTWVGTNDFRGEPDPQLSKVQELRAWGYRVVTDKDGKPVQGPMGVLMEGPPERRAARQAQLTPVGARRKHYEEQFLGEIEDINRQAGRRVLVAEDRETRERF